MAITGRFVVLVAIGIVPIVVFGRTTDTAALVLLVWLALVAVIGCVDLALAASPRRVTLRRELPARVRLGERIEATLFLTNTTSRTLRARIRDAWPPSAGADTRRHDVAAPPGERRSVTVALTPFRRGERAVARVTIRSFGPLGMWARQATIPAPGRILVLPPFTARKHLPSRLARLRELDGRTSVMVRGQGTEFDSLRDYVRGDDVRSIDWRATARRGDADGTGEHLMVRTWRPERDRRVVILIDTGRTSAARIENEPRIDTAYESALLLAALASHAGDRVDVLAFDRRVRGRVQGATGADLVRRCVDMMAGIEPQLIETDWTAVPAQIRSVTPHRALVVLLTAIQTPAAAQGLLGMLPQLTTTHTVLVASVADPRVLDAAAARGGRDEIYRAAAAERALLDASRVAAAVGRLGAEVVTDSPARLPPSLADRYIALKAAGRL